MQSENQVRKVAHQTTEGRDFAKKEQKKNRSSGGVQNKHQKGVGKPGTPEENDAKKKGLHGAKEPKKTQLQQCRWKTSSSRGGG